MKVINVSRKFADLVTAEQLAEIDPGPWAWVYISEPLPYDLTVYSFNYLSTLPHVNAVFWDITKIQTVNIYQNGQWEEMIMTLPTFKNIRPIADFLKEYSNHNLIVSCYAGKCRSGAVAAFAEQYVKYEWVQEFKNKANPNPLVSKLLRDTYFNG
jgi:protein-tyrosine phosphatase